VSRGNLVIAIGPGFGAKPRPFVVLSADEFRDLTTLILLPTTSQLADPPFPLRVRLEPTADNGLKEVSEVMTDIPVTVRANKVHQHIGKLTAEDMARVENALLMVLGFAS
jgi:mRNA interferase MazF